MRTENLNQADFKGWNFAMPNQRLKLNKVILLSGIDSHKDTR